MADNKTTKDKHVISRIYLGTNFWCNLIRYGTILFCFKLGCEGIC